MAMAIPPPPDKPKTFHVLHALIHERDFVVYVNEATQNMVKRIVAEEVRDLPLYPGVGCIACRAGYDMFRCQPSDEDRK